MSGRWLVGWVIGYAVVGVYLVIVVPTATAD